MSREEALSKYKLMTGHLDKELTSFVIPTFLAVNKANKPRFAFRKSRISVGPKWSRVYIG